MIARLFLSLLLLVLPLRQEAATIVVHGPVRYAAAGPTYLLSEGFEGAGYENSWTEGGTGTKDEDYTTSPAPLVGSQSLRLAMSTQNGTTFSAFTGTADVWAYFQINFVTLSPSSKHFFELTDSSGTALLSLELSATNTVRIRVGTANATTVDTVSASTTCRFWVRYTKDGDGGAASAFGEVGFSTDDTKPTSGNKYVSVSTGSSTADAARFYCGSSGNSTWEAIFDKVRVDDVNIGSNPS